MSSNRQETLRRVTQNDPSFKTLTLVDGNELTMMSMLNIVNNTDRGFYSDNSDDYSVLGAAIANNTHLESLTIKSSDDLPLGVADRGFYDGLKSNSSIHQLTLHCGNLNIAGGIWHEILKVYQENSSCLTSLLIQSAGLQSGGDRVIGDTLSNCRNLKIVTLNDCNITHEQLLPIVDAKRGHCMLESLDLGDNDIGNAGCDAIAALLADPNCKLRTLHLERNAIDNEGATTIANSLINNNKLLWLYLDDNDNLINQTVLDIFSKVLCSTSSINQTYSSNHTLQTLDLGYRYGQHLESLLELNTHTNKSHVAMKKILQNHSNIDVESLFEWDAEGEQTLKALPHIINWFERTKVAVADEGKEYGIEERKLSATFQLAKAMPLLFEGIANIKAD